MLKNAHRKLINIKKKKEFNRNSLDIEEKAKLSALLAELDEKNRVKGKKPIAKAI